MSRDGNVIRDIAGIAADIVSRQLISILSLSVPGTDSNVPSVCLPHFLPVKSVLVKKCVKCKMRAKMLRMSDIWRRMMGFERMLSDLWVAPPGGYLRHLGPSPLTAVQRGATFLRHPFLICSSRLWRTTSGGQLLLFANRIFFASNVGTLSKGLKIILSIFSIEYCVM